MAKQNLLAKAEAHANAGRVKEAKRICHAILNKTPEHIEATFLLSGIMMLEKKFQESEPLLRKVLAAQPNHVSAMNNLGVVYREYYKDLKTAESFFKKVNPILNKPSGSARIIPMCSVIFYWPALVKGTSPR